VSAKQACRYFLAFSVFVFGGGVLDELPAGLAGVDVDAVLEAGAGVALDDEPSDFAGAASVVVLEVDALPFLLP
jgi:hypothetical protein